MTKYVNLRHVQAYTSCQSALRRSSSAKLLIRGSALLVIGLRTK